MLMNSIGENCYSLKTYQSLPGTANARNRSDLSIPKATTQRLLVDDCGA